MRSPPSGRRSCRSGSAPAAGSRATCRRRWGGSPARVLRPWPPRRCLAAAAAHPPPGVARCRKSSKPNQRSTAPRLQTSCRSRQPVAVGIAAGVTAPRVTLIGSQRFGRRPQVAWSNPPLLGVLHPGAIGQGRAGSGHRQDEPVPRRRGWGRCAALSHFQPRLLRALSNSPRSAGRTSWDPPQRARSAEDDPGFLLFRSTRPPAGCSGVGPWGC